MAISDPHKSTKPSTCRQLDQRKHYRQVKFLEDKFSEPVFLSSKTEDKRAAHNLQNGFQPSQNFQNDLQYIPRRNYIKNIPAPSKQAIKRSL